MDQVHIHTCREIITHKHIQQSYNKKTAMSCFILSKCPSVLPQVLAIYYLLCQKCSPFCPQHCLWLSTLYCSNNHLLQCHLPNLYLFWLLLKTQILQLFFLRWMYWSSRYASFYSFVLIPPLSCKLSEGTACCIVDVVTWPMITLPGCLFLMVCFTFGFTKLAKSSLLLGSH